MGQECISTVVRVVFRITLKRRELSLQSSLPPEKQSEKFFFCERDSLSKLPKMRVQSTKF